VHFNALGIAASLLFLNDVDADHAGCTVVIIVEVARKNSSENVQKCDKWCSFLHPLREPLLLSMIGREKAKVSQAQQLLFKKNELY
jgi:hypothetical protein